MRGMGNIMLLISQACASVWDGNDCNVPLSRHPLSGDKIKNMRSTFFQYFILISSFYLILLFVGCSRDKNDRQALNEIYNHSTYLHRSDEKDLIDRMIYDSRVATLEIKRSMIVYDSLDRQLVLARLDTMQYRYEKALLALGIPPHKEEANKLLSDYLQRNEGQTILEQGLRFELTALSIWKSGMSAKKTISIADSLSKKWYASLPNQRG
jgi:hypothetical protein